MAAALRSPCHAARRSDSFAPAGGVIVASGLLNLLSTDVFSYSLHSGWRDAEAFFAVTLLQHVLERMNRAQFLEEAITPTLTWLACNWWAPMPGTTATGWKWEKRRWACAANWAVRQAELLVIWGLVLFRPEALGAAASMCPLDALAASTTTPPSPAAGAAASPPPPLLLRYKACGGCCRGPIVFREGALMALVFFSASFWSSALHFKRQYRYLESIPDGSLGPGRGGCALRDPATGELRSFRPLAGAELERYRRLKEYPQADLGDCESVLSFYVWLLSGAAPSFRRWWPWRGASNRVAPAGAMRESAASQVSRGGGGVGGDDEEGSSAERDEYPGGSGRRRGSGITTSGGGEKGATKSAAPAAAAAGAGEGNRKQQKVVVMVPAGEEG